jgi:F-type H+-transporting ATPase subunit gamma
MHTLKEIKTRLNAVNSTRKITSAMELVSSAKLRHAQTVIAGMVSYEEKLNKILTNLLRTGVSVDSQLVMTKPVKNAAIIAFSSNTSLCGTFNANVSKRLASVADEYAKAGISKENLTVYAIGKKIEDYAKGKEYRLGGSYQAMADKPSYAAAAALAETITKAFQDGEIDEVKMIFHHFKSRSVQELATVTFLPFDIAGQRNRMDDIVPGANEYIVEPDARTLVDSLLPKVVCLNLYTALADSNASEHAARTIAMQMATENADKLLSDLTVQYNKLRQQAITNEILDIVRGSMK